MQWKARVGEGLVMVIPCIQEKRWGLIQEEKLSDIKARMFIWNIYE